MPQLKELASNINTPKYLRDIYSILAPKAGAGIGVKDEVRFGAHSLSDIKEIKEIAYEQVKAEKIDAGESFVSLGEVQDGLKDAVPKMVKAIERPYTKDGFDNVMNGIGTVIDPGMYNSAYTPVSIGPMDATACYSSGGLSQLIIDKKAKSVLLNGYQFDSKHPFWTSDKLNTLKEYADMTGYQAKLVDALRDGFIYGGGVLYPVLKRDDAVSQAMTIRQLLQSRKLTKDCIAHWAAVDRWNTVVIPQYNITAADYLFAKQYYIPIAGALVATERSAVIRPKQLPYWGAIRQLGWGVSDYEGYIRSVLAYNILIQSIPIMAQQMSLLMHEIPLDGIIAQNGVETAREFMKENDEQMRKWSMMHPKTVNSFGKVYAVDRTYTGYDELGLMMRQDIAAQSGIPESVLFHTQPKGFSNNTEEALMKQSETVRMTQNAIIPTLDSNTTILIISCFGPDSEEAKNARYVRMSFDSPVVATETERAESGARYAASLASLVQSGVPVKQAVLLLKQFYRNIEITNDFLNAVELREKENIAKKDALDKQKAEPRQNPTGTEMKKHTDELMNSRNNDKAAAKGGNSDGE